MELFLEVVRSYCISTRMCTACLPFCGLWQWNPDIRKYRIILVNEHAYKKFALHVPNAIVMRYSKVRTVKIDD